MSTSQPTPSPLVDPARSTTVHAVCMDFEDRLDGALTSVNDFMNDGLRVHLGDAHDQLIGAVRLLDALGHLGTPAPIEELYPWRFPRDA